MSENNSPLPMLEKRRIEAAMIKNIYDVLVERYGAQEAKEVISKAVIQSAVEQGKEFADQYRENGGQGAPGLLDFAALSDLWEMGGALKKDMLVKTEERLEYNMTHCAYADMYKEMGLADIGHLLSCNRDGTFCLGYNPNMKLERTQTLMEGAPYCDFRYRMESDSNEK